MSQHTTYNRGLKLKVTRRPHETEIKVSRAALKKWKKDIEAKVNVCEKTVKMA